MEPNFTLYDSMLVIRPKLWAPFVVASENSQIAEYLGYGELVVELMKPGKPDVAKLVLEIKKGINLDLHRGSIRLGVVCKPLELCFPESEHTMNFSLYVFYWNGTGERLETFSCPTKNIRTGVAFVL